jgi:hypothetical protein
MEYNALYSYVLTSGVYVQNSVMHLHQATGLKFDLG